MPDKANPRDLSGTIVAFDFGLARIGAAVGNTLLRVLSGSSPLERMPISGVVWRRFSANGNR